MTKFSLTLKTFKVGVLAFSLFSSVANPAWPVSYDIVFPGQVYELDVVGITNPQAIVLSKNQGMITVQIIEGDRSGEVLNVRPDDLLTSDESFKQEVENVGTGAVIAGILFCALTDCNKEESEATVPTSPPVGGRHVFLYNACDEEVSVWVAFHKNEGLRYTLQPHKIAPKDGTYLEADGELIVVDRLSLYTHVTTVKNGVVNDDGERVSFRGSVFEWESRELRVSPNDPNSALSSIRCSSASHAASLARQNEQRRQELLEQWRRESSNVESQGIPPPTAFNLDATE